MLDSIVRWWWAIVVVLLAAGAVAQTLREEVRYRELLANALVRAYRLELAPAQSALLYQNTHDLLWIALDDSRLTLVREDGGDNTLDLRAGDVRLLPSFSAKKLRNDSSSPLRGVLIELVRRGLTAGACGCLAQVEKAICGCTPASHLPELWAFALGRVTLAGTNLAAGQSFATTVRRDDMLLVALTPLHLRDEAVREFVLDFAPGEAIWIKAGDHRLTNAGDGPARFITIEF